VVASALARFAVDLDGRAGQAPEGYEAALSPIYAFAYSVAQNASARAVTRGSSLSRAIWCQSNPGGRKSIAGLALGRLAIPAAVAVINRLGLGPFRAEISALELRRAGLRAMGEVVRSLGIEADYVIFAHTHRAGPLGDEVEGWSLPGGARLTNTGSWLYEAVFMDQSGPANPYWPGRVTLLRETGPPELTSALTEVDFAAVHAATEVAP
jgi:hypothetical protein